MLCARECPDWCLYVEGHTEVAPPVRTGGRPRVRNVLDRFAIDFSLCMYCGICIEVCPFDALHWSPQFEYAEVSILDRPDLMARYAEEVPVTLVDGRQHDYWRVDPARLRAALQRPRP